MIGEWGLIKKENGNKMEERNEGPYEIIEIYHPRSYRLKSKYGKV